MPLTESTFRPHPLLANGHVQTIWPVLLPHGICIPWVQERLELGDGDFLDLNWLRHPAGHGSGRLVVLSHGLEGSADGLYIRTMAAALHKKGWEVLAWNFRGCSGEPNRLLRSYHSGESQDLRTLIEAKASDYDQVALVGFSLGGNITLKYLGEQPPHPKVSAGAAISSPVDLAASARTLDQLWSNKLYLHRFLVSLIAKIEEKHQRFPGKLNVRGLHRIRTFREFDDRYTAPLHGFADAADYWARCSSKPLLPRISVPALIISARNDPFLPAECFPFAEAEANALIELDVPASGGHVGFVESNYSTTSWLEGRVAVFLDRALGPCKTID
jgi:predicted alpha/beta-fold hydrolase